MDVTILASDIATNVLGVTLGLQILAHHLTIDERTIIVLNLTIGQELHIIIRDVVVLHETLHKVNHRWRLKVIQRAIPLRSQEDTVLTAYLRPIVNLFAVIGIAAHFIDDGEFRLRHIHYRVHTGKFGVPSHASTLLWSFAWDVTQQFQQVGTREDV